MPDAPRRVDSWIQWVLLLATIAGSLWSLSGRLSAIEQELRDDGEYHDQETKRLEKLEDEFTKQLFRLPDNHAIR